LPFKFNLYRYITVANEPPEHEHDGDAKSSGREREKKKAGDEQENVVENLVKENSVKDTGGGGGEDGVARAVKETPSVQKVSAADKSVETTQATQKKKKEKEQGEEEEWHPWRRRRAEARRRRLSSAAAASSAKGGSGGGGAMKLGALALLLRLDRPGEFPAAAVKRSFDGGRTWGPLELRPPGVAAVGLALFTFFCSQNTN
jgi:hypothetical protein